MPKKKKPRGRPKSKGETRTVRLPVRLTPAEDEELERLAREESRSKADTLVVRTLGRRF